MDLVATRSVTPPRSSTPLVGRDRELERLTALLADPAVRLVTVTGSAGVGKTRLALEQLALSEPYCAVVAVDLSAITDADLVQDVVVAGLPGRPAIAVGVASRLWEIYDGAPVLLLLDNLEQIDDVGTVLLPILVDYPQLTLLATSITPARIVGEHVLRLAPFSPTAKTDDDPAVQLFAHRARAADAGFVLDATVTPLIDAICQALGGLPLAIELAAARVAAVPPAIMARQLGAAHVDRLLHQRETAGVPERHLSVTAAIDWTVSMLSPDAADVFIQVAVFEEAFALSSAVTVVAPPLDAPDMLDRLSELVDTQLLTLDVADDDEPRFALNRLVRAHAVRRLQGSGRETPVREAHAAYWRGRCQRDVDTARRHWPDVEAALDYTILRGWTDEALRLAVAATPALTLSPGAETLLLPRIDALLTAEHSRDEALEANATLWSALHTPADEDDLVAYGALTGERLRRSVALARSSGDDGALLRALEVTVRSLGVTLDMPSALAALREGLELSIRLGDEPARARFELWAAMAARHGQDVAQADALARAAYERGARVGEDEAFAAAALHLLHSPAGPPEDLEPAIPDLEELLARTEKLGQSLLTLSILTAMFARAMAAGDLEAALRFVEHQLVVASTCARTLPMGGLAPAMSMAQVALARGDVEDAVRIRESIARLEGVLPSLAPTHTEAYLAAVADLRDLVPAQRYEELAAEVAGSSVVQAARIALACARAVHSSGPPVSGSKPVDTAEANATEDQPALTPREREVLVEIARGGTNRDVAVTLGMSAKTVMHHTMSIYRKLGVRGRAEATAWAYRTGVIAPD